MRSFLLVLMGFLLISCASTMKAPSSSPTSTPQKWEGRPVAELTKALGTPGMTNLAANGNTEYIYNLAESQPFSMPFDTRAATVVAPNGATIGVAAPTVGAPKTVPALRECVVIYDVSPQGIVVATRMRGKGC
jgi:hypothetical protein